MDKIKLITNNPDKIKQLESLGISIEERIPSITKTNKFNKDYMIAKKNRTEHYL